MIVTLFRLTRAWLDVRRIEKTEGVGRDEATRIQADRLRARALGHDVVDELRGPDFAIRFDGDSEKIAELLEIALGAKPGGKRYTHTFEPPAHPHRATDGELRAAGFDVTYEGELRVIHVR